MAVPARYSVRDAILLQLNGQSVQLASGHVLLDDLKPCTRLNADKSKDGAVVLGVQSDRGAVTLLDSTLGRLKFERCVLLIGGRFAAASALVWH